MKYYQFKYNSKLSRFFSHTGSVITILFLPSFIVTIVFFSINITFESLVFPDPTYPCLLLAAWLFSIVYMIRYFSLLKGVFLYDDTLEIVDGSYERKKYKTFDISQIVSIEWAGNFRTAPHAHYYVGFSKAARMMALIIYCFTRKPLSNFYGGNSKDCIEIGLNTENGRKYIYVSVDEQIEFMRDVKTKMMEHGNYNPEDDE